MAMTREERLAKMKDRQNKEQKFSIKLAYNIPSNVPRFEPHEGENRIDIIPYRITNIKNPAVTINGLEVGEIDYFQKLEIHKGIGINNNQYMCMKHMFGEPCAICEAQATLYEQGDRDGAKKLYPQERAVYNVIDLDEPEKGIQVWEVSYFWTEVEFRKLAAAKSKRGPTLLFGDFEVGKTISFIGNKEKFNGRDFIKPGNFQFEDREPYDESICDKAYPLDQWYVIPSYDEAQADYLQVDDGQANNEDEYEPPRTSPATMPKKEVNESFEKIAKADEEFLKMNTIDETESPKRERRRREEQKVSCPMKHQFGDDFDRFDDCTKCDDDTYDKCGSHWDEINAG